MNLYDATQAGQIPEKALLASLGCGNPTVLARLNPGESVLDLGSGGGIDVLLSARLLSSEAIGQNPPTVTQEAKSSPCSNIVALAGDVKVNCSSLTPAQQKLIESIPAVLHKILANQLDPDAVMAKLDEISKDVKKIGRGIYSGYDFSGARRQQSPGRTVVVVGEETNVFQSRQQLIRNQQWQKLLELSEAQIAKTPDWLTPYLYSGMANANLGNKTAAIERLRFVQEQAAGDPNYAQADQLLTTLAP